MAASKRETRSAGRRSSGDFIVDSGLVICNKINQINKINKISELQHTTSPKNKHSRQTISINDKKSRLHTVRRTVPD